jgi:hypothetical protein
LGALVVLLVGDNAYMQAAVAGGIDPLEVLNLKVKPNVIIFNDSSGTFRESPQGGVLAISGDWPGSKLYQMKQVFKTLIQNNQNNVSFLTGQFTQSGTTLQNTGAGADRFYYTTDDLTSASMIATDLTLSTTSAADTTGKGLQSWQDIRAGWNQLYYRETGTSTVTCTMSVTVGFYATGALLATELQTQMNACVRNGTPNKYFVTYAGASGRFTFGRCTALNTPTAGCAAGGGNQNFELRWPNTNPNNIAQALGNNTANTGLGTANVQTSATIYGLLRRTTTQEGIDNNVNITCTGAATGLDNCFNTAARRR